MDAAKRIFDACCRVTIPQPLHMRRALGFDDAARVPESGVRVGGEVDDDVSGGEGEGEQVAQRAVDVALRSKKSTEMSSGPSRPSSQGPVAPRPRAAAGRRGRPPRGPAAPAPRRATAARSAARSSAFSRGGGQSSARTDGPRAAGASGGPRR